MTKGPSVSATERHSNTLTELLSDTETQRQSFSATQLHSDTETKRPSVSATQRRRHTATKRPIVSATQRHESLTERAVKVIKVGQVTGPGLAGLLRTVCVAAGCLTGRQSRHCVPHLEQEQASVGYCCVVAREGSGGAAFSCCPSRPLRERDVIASTHLANAQPLLSCHTHHFTDASVQNSDMYGVPCIVSLSTAALTGCPGGGGFMYDRAVVPGDMIKGTFCTETTSVIYIVLQAVCRLRSMRRM